MNNAIITKIKSLPIIYRIIKHIQQIHFRYFVDEMKYSRKLFVEKMGREMDLDNPKSYSDKLQWLKFYWRDDEAIKCSDKYLVREYVAEKGYGYILNKLYGVYDNVKDIDISKLPDKFVFKTNHGSGWNSICFDKKTYNWSKERENLKTWMGLNYYYTSREWVYKTIKPKILCEKYLGKSDGELPMDYKIFCFNGEPKFTYVCIDRHKVLKFDYYDLEWNKKPILKQIDMSDIVLPKPVTYDLMLEISRKLSEPFPCVRVDLYEFEKKVVFGELTFFPSSGMDKFNPEVYDYIFGDMLDISYLM